jgi:hypothetical protein
MTLCIYKHLDHVKRMARLPAVVAVLRGLTVLVVWLTNENRGSLDDRDSRVDFTRHLAWLLVVLPALALVGRYRTCARRCATRCSGSPSAARSSSATATRAN